MPALTLLGASVRAAAFSAVLAGWQPRAIDLFGDRDLADMCGGVHTIQRYPAGFLAALATVPAGEPWLYTGGLENHPRLVDRLASLRPLLGNPGSVLRRVRDPWLLADVLTRAGFAFPATLVAAAARSAGSHSGEAPGSWLVKPLRGSGGTAVRWATPRDFAQPRPGTLLQAFVPGEPASAIYLAHGGQATLLGATRQLVGHEFGLPAPFAYAGSIGPLPLAPREAEQLQSLGHLLARQFGLRGLFGVDFVRTDQTVCPLEVNPRYTASIEILERATNLQATALHVAACGQPAVPARDQAAAGGNAQSPGMLWGKAIVYAQQAGAVPAALQELSESWNVPGALPEMADLPWTGQPLNPGQPVVTVFAHGRTLVEVERALHDRVAEVHALLAPTALRGH